jgi:type IV pilus assembly protein PilA
MGSMFGEYGAPEISRGWLWTLRSIALLVFILLASLAIYPAIADDDSRFIAPMVPLLLANAVILWGLRENPPGKVALALMLGMSLLPAALMALSAVLAFEEAVRKIRAYPLEFLLEWLALLLIPIVVATSAGKALVNLRKGQNAAPWIWVVRGGAVASAVVLAQPLWWQMQAVWVHQYQTNLLTLLFLLALVLVNVVVVWGLRNALYAAARESSLAMRAALGASVCVFVYGVMGITRVLSSTTVIRADSTPPGIWSLLFPAFLLVLPVASAAIAIRVYYLMKPEPGDKRTLAKGYGGAIFCLFLTALFMPNLIDGHHRGSRNEASAVGSLRSINTSEVTYASTYGKSFSPTLAAIGPPAQGSQPNADAADLIGSVLAGGQKSGYNFIYTPGPRDAQGRILSYTVVARPATRGVTGQRSFFTDEDGVIRVTMENRPATVSDSPI